MVRRSGSCDQLRVHRQNHRAVKLRVLHNPYLVYQREAHELRSVEALRHSVVVLALAAVDDAEQ